MKNKLTIITAICMISAFGLAIYLEPKPIEIEPKPTHYNSPEPKDWNSEEVSTSKRLWMEKLSKL